MSIERTNKNGEKTMPSLPSREEDPAGVSLRAAICDFFGSFLPRLNLSREFRSYG